VDIMRAVFTPTRVKKSQRVGASQAVTGALKVLGLGMALSIAAYSSASATTFNWNPGAPGLVSGAGTIGPADSIGVRDYFHVSFSPGGTGPQTFTENGYLLVSDFELGGSPATPPGLGSTYSIYFGFAGTGTLSGIPTAIGSSKDGTFTSLNYTMYLVKGAQPSIKQNPPIDPIITIPSGATPIPIAYGSYNTEGFVNLLKVSATGYRTTADLTEHFAACTAAGLGNSSAFFGNTLCTADESAFFVSPPALFGLVTMFGDFSSLAAQTKLTGSNLYVTNGGGTLAFDVPEPASFAVFGVGLLGLGVVASRRNKGSRHSA